MKKIIILCSMLIAAVMLCPIVLAEETYEYVINDISTAGSGNNPIEYKSGSCSVTIDFNRNYVRDGAGRDYLLISAYDVDMKLVGFYLFSTNAFEVGKPMTVSCLINVDDDVQLARISAHIWGNSGGVQTSEIKTLWLNTAAEPTPQPTATPKPTATPAPTATPEPKADRVTVDGTLVAKQSAANPGVSADMLRIRRSESAARTNDYALGDNAKLYVNDRDYCRVAGNENSVRDLMANSQGSATLADDDSDGRYDRIMIDYYIIAAVEGAIPANGGASVSTYEPIYSSAAMVHPGTSFEIPANASVTRDGKAIKPSELTADDVLAVKYNIKGTIDESSFMEIIATNETISGRYTGYDDESGIYIIGREEYVATTYILDDLSIGKSHVLRLDPFGRLFAVADSVAGDNTKEDEPNKDKPNKDNTAEESTNNKNFAIVESYVDVSVSTSSSSDTDYMRVVTLDGKIKTLYVDGSYQETVRGIMSGKGIGTNSSVTTAAMENRIIEYELRKSNGKVSRLSFVPAQTVADAQYIQNSNRLGESLSKNALVLDATEYDKSDKSSTAYEASSLSKLTDGTVYDAILVNKNSNNEYTYVIIKAVGEK